jgi:hypothetical protein
MYTYYVLRGTQKGQEVELDGEVNEEQFPGIELDDGPAILTTLLTKLDADGITGEWVECDLTHDIIDREDLYLYFNGRWIRRSETPWRRDRA